MKRFSAGCDLGKLQDYTAVAVIERVPHVNKFRVEGVDDAGKKVPAALHVRHLQRFALGTEYWRIAEELKAMLAREPLRGESALAMDYTGVGVAVEETFKERGLDAAPVLITGAGQQTRQGKVWHVPKADLIVGLLADMQSGRLVVAGELPEAKTLVSELLTMEYHHTPAANVTYCHREGKHDDLVLAVALARWATTLPSKASWGF